MNNLIKVLISVLFLFQPLLLPRIVWPKNNIEFLDKKLIKELNFGIYEVVTPKLESDKITYARELPFDSLDFVERNEKFFSIGTAFFINEKEMMTAAHVFSLEYFSLLHDFYIRDALGNVYPVNMIRQYSTHRDMVVFDLKEYPTKIHPLKLEGEVEIGDTVFSAGNAQGEGIAYRAGQVASFTPERENGEWMDIRFSAPASPGNSGGPLLNLHGNVVGLIVKKNESENYNVAVPIGEAAKLSDEAEFHIRNLIVGIYGVEDTLSKDWRCTLKLPATVEDVATKAQDNLNAFFEQHHTELKEKVKDRNYPRGERFRNYLRNQPYVIGLAPIVPSTNFNSWVANGGRGKQISISESQNVFLNKGKYSDLHVIIEKPADISLEQFLGSPKIAMDSLLTVIPMSRQVGNDKISITSFGEPEEKHIIKDKLGRKWISSLWNLPYINGFVYSSCLPYPKGVICKVDIKQNVFRKFGYFYNIHDSYNEICVGYDGSIDDWEEYFSLGEKYLPKILEKSEIRREGGRLEVQFDDFKIDFNSDKINKNSNIHIHMGYANEKLLAEEILLFEIFPVKGDKSHYRIQPFYEPDVLSSDEYKTTWDSVINKTGDYSGEVVNKGDELVIRRAIDDTKTTFSSIHGRKISKVFANGCFYKTSDKEIENDCREFVQSILFNNQAQ